MPYVPRQYESSRAFIKNYNNLGNITDPMDAMRVNCYNLFDDLYYNRPEFYRVTMRGDSDVEIYLPSTKKIVNSTARYLAVDFSYSIKGDNQDAVKKLFDDLFVREEIQKKHVKSKRSYLTRGDMVWYITADTSKPLGKRITINTIHPSCVFPIEDLNNAYRIVGYHVVDLVHDPRDVNKDLARQIARRQTYRFDENGFVTSETKGFEVGCWDDRYLTPDKLKPVWTYMPLKTLPIKSLPLYLIPNEEPDGSTFGISQVSGMEYIINAMNQSMTYEDLSLVLQGLGVYVTTAAPPNEKATGRPGKYKLHPGNVIEMNIGDTFERVTGVNSIAPFQEHITAMDKWMMQGSGIPDMAAGIVDVQVASSGISLALQMGPIISENEDKQLSIGGKWEHLAYDLITYWFPAYEGVVSPNTKFTSIFGDPMPINRDTYVTELVTLYLDDMITLDEVREKLELIGYQNTPGVVDKLMSQKLTKSQASTGDPSLFNQQPPNLANSLGGNNGNNVSSSLGNNGKLSKLNG